MNFFIPEELPEMTKEEEDVLDQEWNERILEYLKIPLREEEL